MNYFLDFWIWASPSIQSAQDTAIHWPVKNWIQRTKINTGKSVCQCLTRQRRRRDLIQSTVVFLSCTSYTWVCAFITRWTRKESTLTILLLLLWSFCGYVLSVFFISCPCSLSYYCTSSLSLPGQQTDSRPWNKLLLGSWVRPEGRWCGWWQPGGGEESISSRFGAKKNTTTAKKEEKKRWRRMQFNLMKSTTNFGFKEVKQYNSKSMRKDDSARPSSSSGPPGTGEENMGRNPQQK